MTEQHFNALPAGYQLQEYTVKSVLGHGGFGITYLAADNNLGKDVAIKEYLPTEFAVRRDDSQVQPRSTADNDDYEWGLDRFMKEAQTLGLFRHPNIVPVYRAFKENGTAYMVMEYQKGQPLSDIFRKHRAEFTEDDLMNLILPLLDGLGVVHQAGYLHRDLKPGNIFIREDGSPVLLDFGAARNAVGRKSKNLTSIVTPGYAPLEQYFADGNQGPWTDIYAMASILYQAVAGRIPPEAPARVKRDPITPALEAGRGRFSEAFLSGIDIGLRVEEEQRPQSVDQWRAMLLGQEVPEAVPMGQGAAAPEAASVRASATMLAGPGVRGRASPPPSSAAGSASMRFPTVARDDAAPKRSGGGAKIAAIVAGVVLLLAASGVGAYVALNPDHGLFGTSSNNTNASDTEARRRAEDEARRKAEAEAKRRAEDDEARRKAEQEEARRKAEQDEARRKAEQDEARRKAEQDEARRKAEQEEARRKAEQEEARRKADEERRKADEEAKRRADDPRKAEEEARRREEARRADEERRRAEDEARRRDEARRADEERRKADEEKRRREQEEARRRDEENNRAQGVTCDASVSGLRYASEIDCYFVQRTFAYTLTTARDGAAPSTWSNPRTGSSGTISIISTQQRSDGTMCRQFRQTVTVNGRTMTGTGTACFRNNVWTIG